MRFKGEHIHINKHVFAQSRLNKTSIKLTYLDIRISFLTLDIGLHFQQKKQQQQKQTKNKKQKNQ